MTYEGNGSDGKHYWLTPPELMAEMAAEFAFDFDPCPYPQPEGFDGLTADWGQSNYVNPPFKGPTAWVRKAIEENRKGKRVVFVFPIDKWVLMMLEAGATVRNLRDVHWCAIEDGQPGKGTGRHIAMFILEAHGLTSAAEDRSSGNGYTVDLNGSSAAVAGAGASGPVSSPQCGAEPAMTTVPDSAGGGSQGGPNDSSNSPFRATSWPGEGLALSPGGHCSSRKDSG